MEAAERETIINMSDADETVRIWTAQRKVITKLRKNDAFTQIGAGFHDGTEWAEFTIPASRWTPSGGVKRVLHLTEEQRAARAERFALARGAR